MNICYKELNITEIDLIKPLWEKLNSHHGQLSTHFQKRYIEFTFEERKAQLLKKYENGSLRVEMAEDDDQCIGYCISSISNSEGEIDSIYVDKKYRSLGIGKKLMGHSLSWMDEKGMENKKIVVAAGNEDSLKFYERYNFFPAQIILEQSK